MEGHVIATTVMLSLGSFQFGISSAAYQELTRSTEFRWPSQDRFGSRPSSQFTGLGADTITLPGVIYPEYRGGLGQINAMRDMAERGEALTMITGNGNILGAWAIERVEEKQTIFAAAGVPRKMEFTLNLKRVGQETAATLASLTAQIASNAAVTAASVKAAATPEAAAKASLAGIANGVVISATALAGKLAAAASNITTNAGLIGASAQTVLSSLTRSLDVVNGIKAAGQRAISDVAAVKTVADAVASSNRLLGETVRLGRIASGQSGIIKTVSDAMTNPTALTAVKGAMASVNRVTAMASNATNEAGKLIRNLS